MIKEVRVKLSGHAADCFAIAKVAAEKELGFALRDNEFAARVITNVVCNLPVRANEPNKECPIPRPDFGSLSEADFKRQFKAQPNIMTNEDMLKCSRVVTVEESQAITDEFKGE